MVLILLALTTLVEIFGYFSNSRNMPIIFTFKIPMKKSVLQKLAGIFIVATFIISCSKKENFTEDNGGPIEDINIGLTFRKASLRDQPVEFKVFDEDGVEIVENVTFFIDGEVLTSNMYQSSEEGIHEVYAEYEVNGSVITTETETFSVVIPKQKVVMEDYTGTWCGYCPSMDAAIKDVIDLTTHYTAIAIHNNDELALTIEPILREEFLVYAFPSGRLNRTAQWGSTINFPIEDALEIAGTANPIGISIAPLMVEGTLSVKVSVASEESLQDKKLVVYLLEDGILGDQVNYFNEDPSSPYFGMGNPIPNFELNHVLRASLSDPFGDVIPPTGALTDYEAAYTYSVPVNFEIEKLSVVAMVVDMDNTALNSQRAHVNEPVYYE